MEVPGMVGCVAFEASLAWVRKRAKAEWVEGVWDALLTRHVKVGDFRVGLAGGESTFPSFDSSYNLFLSSNRSLDHVVMLMNQREYYEAN
jgi:hypothetical protein